VRVDDIGWQSSNKRDRGLELAQKFHEAMAGQPYLAAVIPGALDRDGVDWLTSSPACVTVALHGLVHQRSEDDVASEFRGMDLEKCRNLICRGKRILENMPIKHMVLPFNAYEPQLDEACYLEGIRWIWGGANHSTVVPSSWPTPPQPYPLGRLGFVPSWAPTYAATHWRMGADDVPLCETLPRILEWPGKCVLTLHITWEASRSRDFAGVRWLSETISNHVITIEEYLA
jgi:hypothetical protein